MLNINKLLKKKSWTGAELGRLELANAALTYKKAVDTNDPEQEPAINRKDLENMLSTLKDPAEGRIYNGYIAIHKWISETMQVAAAQNQQAHLRFNSLWSYVQNAIVSEDVYSYIEELPLIMTEKQYKETVEKREQETLKPSGEETGLPVMGLIFHALEHYMNLLQTQPESKNPLMPLKKKLEKELVKDPNILENYNKVRGLGYYTLEDGTRSDKVSPTEWRKFVTATIVKLMDEDTGLEDTGLGEKETQMVRRAITEARYMYQEGEIKEGFSKAFQWHYYEDSPEGLLTKWEVLEEGELWKYYSCEDGATEEEEMEKQKAFASEFPTVVKALLDDIGKRYGMQELKDLPIEKWTETIYSWEDLYKSGFCSLRANELGDDSIFNGNKRAAFNGIAILRASDIRHCTRIDPETGHYKAPEIRNSLFGLSLEAFFPGSETYSDKVDAVKQDKELLISSLYFVEGFNKALELIASIFDIEEVKFFSVDTDGFRNTIKSLNSSIYMLYRRIKNTDYEEPELREKKLEVLEDVFQPINLKKLRIPEDKLEIAKQNMQDFKGFEDSSIDPYLQLCIYKPEDIEGI